MLTADRLHELLDYDSETGEFHWRGRSGRGGRRHAGRVAGKIDTSGHRQIGIDGKAYLAHRLVWLFVHGRWPTHQVDHLNGARDDNRLVNLREVTNAQNAQNTSRLPRSNTSGYLGVSQRGRRWSAQITVDGRIVRLGCFATAAQAHEAYLATKRRLHPFWSEVAS